MRAGVGRRVGLALVAVLLVLLSMASWPVPAASAATCGADMGTRQVVVLVHGFNSDIKTWTKYKPAMLAAVHDADPANVYVRLFDYGSQSTQWVTDPAIGPALASFVRCLSKASTEAGGPGQVILVGHSMGGLAIRCALDADCSPNPVGKDQVGLVVTIGTPNAGSQIRPSPAADSAARRVGEELLALCDIAQIINGDQWLSTICQYADALGDSPAAQAFTIGSDEINELAPYPLHIPVRAIAAASTLQTEIGLWHSTLPLGDIVVGVDSQLMLHTNDRLGGTRTVNCGAINIRIDDEPHCWHITETAFPPIQSEVRQAITDYLKANPRGVSDVVLGPHGSIVVAGTNIASVTRDQAIAALTSALGKPTVQVSRPGQVDSYGMCDTHLIYGTVAKWGSLRVLIPSKEQPPGLVTNIEHPDRVSGWSLGKYDNTPPQALRTARGVGVGSSLAAVQKAYPGSGLSPYDGSQIYTDPGTDLQFGFAEISPDRVRFMDSGLSCGS